MRSSYSNTREISGWSPNPESTQNLLSPYPRWDRSEVSSMSFKVLIVDDEPDLEVLIRQRFRKKIKDGEFEFLVKPIDFQDLEVTLNRTIQELQGIKTGLRAREELAAIQHELGVAARIQQSMLPKQVPQFPDRTEFEVYAQMLRAKEVGGD